MIKRGALLLTKRIRLEDLRVFEYQKRYPDQVTRYLGQLAENERDDLGLIHVKACDWGYEILDGHHRYVALVLSGRVDALCLVIDEDNI